MAKNESTFYHESTPDSVYQFYKYNKNRYKKKNKLKKKLYKKSGINNGI